MHIGNYLTSTAKGAAIGAVIAGVPSLAFCSAYYHFLEKLGNWPDPAWHEFNRTMDCVATPVKYGAALGAGVNLFAKAFFDIVITRKP